MITTNDWQMYLCLIFLFESTNLKSTMAVGFCVKINVAPDIRDKDWHGHKQTLVWCENIWTWIWLLGKLKTVAGFDKWWIKIYHLSASIEKSDARWLGLCANSWGLALKPNFLEAKLVWRSSWCLAAVICLKRSRPFVRSKAYRTMISDKQK